MGCATLAAHDPITTKVTWTREISSILERRCVSCHIDGGYAGFALTTYEAARPWAVAIKEEVLSGDMPPWGAAPGVGHFANDRRITRHEQELIAAWVDGGAPYSPEFRIPLASDPSRPAIAPGRRDGGVALPLAPAEVTEARERTASVTLQVPAGTTLAAWTFEPGAAAAVERVDLELASRWVGTWTPGEASIEFPDDSGVPLATSALFTARITYRRPAARVVDHSRLRLWMAKEPRSKSLREVTVIRSWRAMGAIDLVAVRPVGESGETAVVARFSDGRVEMLGELTSPSQGPQPTYQLARQMPLPAGTRIETTQPVRLLYSAAGTRTVKPNVSRRPRR